jgi:hypothetical protein
MFGCLIEYFVPDQLWEMDNIKIFYDSWIPIAVPFVTQFLLFFVKGGQKAGIFDRVFRVLSGYICTCEYLVTPCDICKKKDIGLGNWIAENTRTDDTFLTNQPTATIRIRKLFVGYLGWVVSHGVDSEESEKDLEDLKAHPNDIEKFRRLGIGYAVESGFAFNVSER